MKKMTKRTLSLVLVIALVFSLGVTALAAEPETITFNPSTYTVYVGKSATVTANLNNYTNYVGNSVTWTAADTNVTVSGTDTVGNDGKLTATVTGNVVSSGIPVTAEVKDGDTVMAKGSFTVIVNANNVKSVVISDSAGKSVSNTTLYLAKGNAVTLNAKNVLESGDAATGEAAKAAWTTSSASIATVSTDNAQTITVQGVSDGTSTITATAASGANSIVNVTVYSVSSATIPTTATVAKGSSITLSRTTVTNPSGAVAGSGTWTSTDAAVASVNDKGVVTGEKEGTAKIYCTVDGVKSNECTVTVTAATNVTGVTVTPASVSVGVGSTTQLTATVAPSNATNKTVTWTTSNSAVAAVNASTGVVTGVKAGTATITATTADGSKTASCTVTVTQSSVNAYATFMVGGDAVSMDGTNGYTTTSIQTQLTNSIPNLYYITYSANATGTNCGTFSGKTDGTLYYLNAGIFYKNIADSSFTPGTVAGTYSIGYTAYNSSNTAIASGTISFVVKEVAAGDVSVYYNLKTSGSVTLTDNDFASWYQSQFTSTYVPDLYYVVFNSYPSSGSLKSGTSTVNSSTSYFVSGFAATNSKLLSSVKYTAGTAVGCYPVSFTAYGKNGTNAKTGTVFFCVNKAEVTDISYNVAYGINASLYESDFSSVYSAATKTTTTSPKLTVKFISLPSNGTLYYAGKTTSGYLVNTAQTFRVNYTGTSYNNLNDVTYVPGKYTSGTDTAVYALYNGNGEMQYVGTVKFVYGVSTAAITCYAEGHGFSSGDFTAPSASDPISYVQFTGVSTGGKLFYNYANGTGTAVTTAQKFYASTAVTGALPLNKVTFISKAGQVAAVSVGYTAVTKAGKTVSGTLTMNMATRATALKFSDVNAAWAVGSVDYVSTWGLMDGVGSGKFNPNGTMTRAMLVTIIYRMAGSPSFTGLANPFTDVSNSSSNWYRNAVVWAYNKGIVTGTSKTTFSPNSAVSRQDIASMLWRYAGEPSGYAGYISGYPDASNVASYAQSAMGWAVASGIITGNGGRLLPTANGSRAEVSVMLHRYLTSF